MRGDPHRLIAAGRLKSRPVRGDPHRQASAADLQCQSVWQASRPVRGDLLHQAMVTATTMVLASLARARHVHLRRGVLHVQDRHSSERKHRLGNMNLCAALVCNGVAFELCLGNQDVLVHLHTEGASRSNGRSRGMHMHRQIWSSEPRIKGDPRPVQCIDSLCPQVEKKGLPWLPEAEYHKRLALPVRAADEQAGEGRLPPQDSGVWVRDSGEWVRWTEKQATDEQGR